MKINRKGQGLASVLIAGGIGAIIIGFITDMMIQQGIGQKFLTQKLEINDLNSNIITTVGKHFSSKSSEAELAHEGFLFFRKYKNNSVASYAESILNISPENLYFYNSGFALALTLDQIKPDWKKSAFKNKQFLFGELLQWCKEAKL